MPQGSQNQEDEWFMDYDFNDMNSMENRERNVNASGLGAIALARIRNISPIRTPPKKVILNLDDENVFDAEALQDFWIRRNRYGYYSIFDPEAEANKTKADFHYCCYCGHQEQHLKSINKKSHISSLMNSRMK